MFVDCDQGTGMPLSGHVSVGHRTLASIREDGFEVMRTRRGVPCTEIHHSAPFCIVWPKANEVSACDECDGAGALSENKKAGHGNLSLALSPGTGLLRSTEPSAHSPLGRKARPWRGSQ